MIYIIGQCFGVVAIILGVISYQMKTQRQMLFVLTATATVFCIHYFMIDAITGMAMNAVNIIRNIAYDYRARKGNKSMTIPIIFAVIQAVMGILTWEAWYSVFIFIGVVANTVYMSFSNAQTLVGLGTKRKLIIDSSVFGMGRGAGNLCTELFLHHLNEKYGAQYKLNPLYEIFENNISDVYKKSPWGYSLPRFISAKNTCSADYSAHLNKRNMKLADMDETLSRLPQEKRTVFNEKALDIVA